MTKINKMVLSGFKSFAKHTELVFGDNFNCVIGPNGSGKSNILDALCFVLGRMSAKSMRAEKSANLIYNGGKNKAPAKHGEVSLYFDNKEKTFPMDNEEVKITRVIKKGGQSDYLINDEKRTRQQILELMSVARIDSNGFNIILQGDIVRFTEMPLEQRREIIEEISGISVYEEKKQKAIRELDRVDERLKEASIVLNERNSYLKELKKERDQALEFRELEGQIKENKASYLYMQIEEKEKEKKEHEDKIAGYAEKLDGINNNIDNFKKNIFDKKKTIEDINKQISEKGEKGQVAMQKEIEDMKVKIATSKTRKDNIRSEIDKIALRKQQLEKDLLDSKDKVEELKKQRVELEEFKKEKASEIKELESKISKFREDNSIDNASNIEKEIEEIDNLADEKQKEIEKLRLNQQELIRKKDSLEFQYQNLDSQIEKIEQIEKEHATQLKELKEKKEKFKKLTGELNKSLEEDSMIARRIGEKREELSVKEKEFAKLNAKQLTINETSRGSIAIKHLMDQKRQGVYGTIKDLGSVKTKYSTALEIAAGPRINSIVVEDDKVASDCIKYLKSNKLGSATFLPLNKIKPRSCESVKDYVKSKGTEGLAIDLIDFDPKFKNAFSYLFGDTIVVDDIDSARNIGIGNARMVTITGDLTETSGAMHGGFKNKRGGAGFSIKEVTKNLKNCEKEVAELSESLSILQKRRSENEEKVHEMRKEKADLEGDIIKTERSLHLESGDLDSTTQKKDNLKEDISKAESELISVEDNISTVTTELMKLKSKKQQLRDSLGSVRDPAVIAELNAFEQKRNEYKEKLMETEGKIKSIITELDEMRIPELKKFEDVLKGLVKEKEKFSHDMKTIDSEVDEMQSKLSSKEKDAKKFYQQYRELFNQRSKVEDSIGSDEKNIDELRDKGKDLEIKINQINMIAVEVKAKLAALKDEFSSYEGVKINKEKDASQLKKEIESAERKISNIGSVNMKALDVYDEVEKEYSSLLSKKEKLETEKDDVVNMMEEIDSRKRELFMRSFNAVNNKFQEFFSSLSTKGEAFLELENEEKPFEGGIDIKVRITGSKFLDIRSLSGGEKTMTALAFIFAIQEYQPHSFYILDEIDAALDKHNAEKLAALIRKYVEKAQYIVISHNDAVITEADNLYGISMNEHSVSNVTTLKI